MTDREKVIHGLEICTKDIPMSNAVHKSDFCKECPYYNAENRYCWNQIAMIRDALALLKEQGAVKPKSKVRHGANAQIQHFCGNCNAMLHGKPQFCSECGKRVLW